MEKTKIIRFEIPGEPMGKQRPRVVRVGGFSRAYTPKKTADYENLVRLAYNQEAKGERFEDDVMIGMKVNAYYKIPKSTSKAKAKDMVAEILRPKKKPDADNVAKAVMDALNGVAYKDDAAIVFLQVAKYYAVIPRVEVVLWEKV